MWLSQVELLSSKQNLASRKTRFCQTDSSIDLVIFQPDSEPRSATPFFRKTSNTALESSRREERSYSEYKRSYTSAGQARVVLRSKTWPPSRLSLGHEGHGGLQVRHVAPHAALIRAAGSLQAGPEA